MIHNLRLQYETDTITGSFRSTNSRPNNLELLSTEHLNTAGVDIKLVEYPINLDPVDLEVNNLGEIIDLDHYLYGGGMVIGIGLLLGFIYMMTSIPSISQTFTERISNIHAWRRHNPKRLSNILACQMAINNDRTSIGLAPVPIHAFPMNSPGYIDPNNEMPSVLWIMSRAPWPQNMYYEAGRDPAIPSASFNYRNNALRELRANPARRDQWAVSNFDVWSNVRFAEERGEV